MPGALRASCFPALPVPHRLGLLGGTGAYGYPPSRSSGWQREAGGRRGPLGKGALDELQCQHICENITNYFPHYKHPAGRQGSNQPKLFKIETEIAAQGCQGNWQSRSPAPGGWGSPHQLPLYCTCSRSPNPATPSQPSPPLARWKDVGNVLAWEVDSLSALPGPSQAPAPPRRGCAEAARVSGQAVEVVEYVNPKCCSRKEPGR